MLDRYRHTHHTRVHDHALLQCIRLQLSRVSDRHARVTRKLSNRLPQSHSFPHILQNMSAVLTIKSKNAKYTSYLHPSPQRSRT